jgi:prevent-host-death family protein
MKITEDIRSVTELKRNMKEVFAHMHKTKRPIILTVNGKADAVLMDAKTYEEQFAATQLTKLLAKAEREFAAGLGKPMKDFLKEFKRARKIPD